MKPRMEIGGRYNWRGQPERLIYLGKNWSGNGYWHQFALVSEPEIVWCEVTDSDLYSFEETMQCIKLDLPGVVDRGLDKYSSLSARQQRKARKAAKRVAAQAAAKGENGNG